jgi:hypothetical protein
MKRFSLWIVAFGLLASACRAGGAVSAGPAPSGRPTPTQSPSPSPTSNPSPTVTPTSNRKVTYELWFDMKGKLFVTKRTEPFSPRVAQLSLDGLLRGPTDAEARAGLMTAIPEPTSVQITELMDGVASVATSGPFSNGPLDVVRFRQAQVVYTLTQYSTIRRVSFGPGQTYSRRSFERFLPAILVESPIIGARVSSPVTVSGTANVFEATVSLRILDENGKEIAHTFTTATCGTGCRGDYSVSVPFNVDHEQQGTIEVFESSAKDGSAINVVSIPVILMP